MVSEYLINSLIESFQYSEELLNTMKELRYNEEKKKKFVLKDFIQQNKNELIKKIEQSKYFNFSFKHILDQIS